LSFWFWDKEHKLSDGNASKTRNAKNRLCITFLSWEELICFDFSGIFVFGLLTQFSANQRRIDFKILISHKLPIFIKWFTVNKPETTQLS
jgi:hypothetical protein